MDRRLRSALRLSLLAVPLLLAPLARVAWTADLRLGIAQRQIENSQLEPDRAVALKGTRIEAGLATLVLEDGVLFPASRVWGKTMELVFLDKGRILLEPPDEIEQGQLELFAGTSRLDLELTELVLVLGQDAAVDALLSKPGATPEPLQARRAAELYAVRAACWTPASSSASPVCMWSRVRMSRRTPATRASSGKLWRRPRRTARMSRC